MEFDPTIAKRIAAVERKEAVMEEQPDEVEVKTGVGSFRARGADLIKILILLVVCYIAFWTMGRTADAKNEHKEITQAITSMAEQQEQANYILTLAPEERIKLRIEMPEGLRKKLRDR